MSEETTIRRCFRTEKLRVDERDGKSVIVGLAVPYGAPSEDLGGFREVFKRGAFKDSLGDDIFADVEHDRSKKLGRTAAGTVTFKSAREGLRAEIQVPDTTVGRDALEEVRNGSLDAMSIAFMDPEEEWRGSEGNLTRHIGKATLRAVTLTSFPAFPQTAGTLTERSLAEYRASQKPPEEGAEYEGPETEELRRRLDLAEAELPLTTQGE